MSSSNPRIYDSCLKCADYFVPEAQYVQEGYALRSSVPQIPNYCTRCQLPVVLESHLDFLAKWVCDDDKVVPLQFISEPHEDINYRAVLRCIETNINERLSQLFGTVHCPSSGWRELFPLHPDFSNWDERIQSFKFPYRMDRFSAEHPACRKLLEDITEEIYYEAVPQFLMSLYMTERGKILHNNPSFYMSEDMFKCSSSSSKRTHYQTSKDATRDIAFTQRRWWVRQLFIRPPSFTFSIDNGLVLNFRYVAEMVPLAEPRSPLVPRLHAYTIGDIFDELLNKIY